MVLLHQLTPENSLIDWRLPTHLEHLIFGPQKIFGMPVTIKAPRHMEILRFPGQRHLINAAMTRLATNAFIHVNTVIEVDEVRQAIDAVPTDRTIIA